MFKKSLSENAWDESQINGAQILTLIGHAGSVNDCVWSPDGKRILSASNDGTLKIWDANTGKELQTLTRHKGPVQRNMDVCAWSPNGQHIFSSTADESFEIWDLKNDIYFRKIEKKGYSSRLGAWSPDGSRILAVVGYTIKILDVTGKQLQEFAGHRDLIGCFEWSPDGQLILSVEEFYDPVICEGKIRIWNAETGIELQTVSFLGFITRCNWFPDGRRILFTTWTYPSYS